MAGQSATIKRTKERLLFSVALALGGMIAVPLMGCQSNDDGIPSAEKKNASRLDEMAKSSGGDMAKLSPADRDYLVNEIAHGNENSAKMMLGVKAGTLGKRPDGAGGPAGGPPK